MASGGLNPERGLMQSGPSRDIDGEVDSWRDEVCNKRERDAASSAGPGRRSSRPRSGGRRACFFQSDLWQIDQSRLLRRGASRPLPPFLAASPVYVLSRWPCKRRGQLRQEGARTSLRTYTSPARGGRGKCSVARWRAGGAARVRRPRGTSSAALARASTLSRRAISAADPAACAEFSGFRGVRARLSACV